MGSLWWAASYYCFCQSGIRRWSRELVTGSCLVYWRVGGCVWHRDMEVRLHIQCMWWVFGVPLSFRTASWSPTILVVQHTKAHLLCCSLLEVCGAHKPLMIPKHSQGSFRCHSSASSTGSRETGIPAPPPGCALHNLPSPCLRPTSEFVVSYPANPKLVHATQRGAAWFQESEQQGFWVCGRMTDLKRKEKMACPSVALPEDKVVGRVRKLTQMYPDVWQSPQASEARHLPAKLHNR